MSISGVWATGVSSLIFLITSKRTFPALLLFAEESGNFTIGLSSLSEWGLQNFARGSRQISASYGINGLHGVLKCCLLFL